MGAELKLALLFLLLLPRVSDRDVPIHEFTPIPILHLKMIPKPRYSKKAITLPISILLVYYLITFIIPSTL